MFKLTCISTTDRNANAILVGQASLYQTAILQIPELVLSPIVEIF